MREKAPVSCLLLLLAISERSTGYSNALALLFLLLAPCLIFLLPPSCLLSLLAIENQEDKSGSKTHDYHRLDDVPFFKGAQIGIGTGHCIFIAVVNIISVIAHLILQEVIDPFTERPLLFLGW